MCWTEKQLNGFVSAENTKDVEQALYCGTVGKAAEKPSRFLHQSEKKQGQGICELSESTQLWNLHSWDIVTVLALILSERRISTVCVYLCVTYD